MLNTFTKGDRKKQNERSDFRKRSKNIIAKLYTQNIIITREKSWKKIQAIFQVESITDHIEKTMIFGSSSNSAVCCCLLFYFFF